MSVSLAPVQTALENLQRAVQTRPRGTNLEDLIESHLTDINRLCYETLLENEREKTADAASSSCESSASPEVFPPSGLSEMRRAPDA